MENLQVRPAGREDYDFCHETDSVYRNVGGGEERLRHKIELGDVLIADLSGEKVGYLRVDRFSARVPYIGLIYVRENIRSQGIGIALLEYLEDRTREEGGEIILSSCHADEPSPQYWHRKWGFREAGVIDGVNRGGVSEIVFLKKVG